MSFHGQVGKVVGQISILLLFCVFSIYSVVSKNYKCESKDITNIPRAGFGWDLQSKFI